MPAQVESMAYGRAVPWHGLGVRTDNPLSTSEEMLKAASLDWSVGKVPMTTVFGTMVPNAWATVRESDGAVLGVVGDSYRIVQNRDAFAWADSLVDDGSAKYETAGSLFGGKRVFLSMELPQGIRIDGDESEVKPYLLVTNGHDGGTILQASVTMVRVVCANTWTLALDGASRTFRIRHSGSPEGKLAAAREALGITFEYEERFAAVAEALSLRTVSNRQVDDILRKAFPIPPTQDRPDRIEQSDWFQVRELYRTTENLDPIRGTAWGVLQAAGEYVDHVVDYHGRRFDDDDVRMDSIVYGGPAAVRKQKVLRILQDLPKPRVAVVQGR